MKKIDLDDLPPRIAQSLATLSQGEELVLVQDGLVIARLHVAVHAASAEAPIDPPGEDRMTEVMEQFNALIHDEF